MQPSRSFTAHAAGERPPAPRAPDRPRRMNKIYTKLKPLLTAFLVNTSTGKCHRGSCARIHFLRDVFEAINHGNKDLIESLSRPDVFEMEF